jgi:hypothetical protein
MTYLDASEAVASITVTHFARKVKDQSRCILVPRLYLTMFAFPPRNFSSDLPFFCKVLRGGLGFFPEGSATLCRHWDRSNGYSQSAIGAVQYSLFRVNHVLNRTLAVMPHAPL